MSTVLLRSAWLNAFMHDTHLRPAKRKLGQAEQAVPSKRSPVVHADPSRHAVLAHRCFADSNDLARFAAERRARRGLGKPETFNFLGFTHICGHSRAGYFLLKRKTRRDRMRGRLRAIKEELRRRMHEPIPEQGRWLGQVLRGYFAYHAVPTNTRSLCAFRHHVTNLWRRSLRRRSQRDRTTWDRAAQLVAAFLPAVRIIHPWPHERFAVNHPRWKPGARIAPAGFCAGGAQQ
jgi:RNA-directed DNA polymerase